MTYPSLFSIAFVALTAFAGCSSTDVSEIEPYATLVGQEVLLPHAMMIWDQSNNPRRDYPRYQMTPETGHNLGQPLVATLIAGTPVIIESFWERYYPFGQTKLVYAHLQIELPNDGQTVIADYPMAQSSFLWQALKDDRDQ